MLSLHLDDQAKRFISKRTPKHAGQISNKIAALCENPDPPDAKGLKGSEYHRADIGEYRILYHVFNGLLYVRLVGKRNDNEVYKQLERLEG